MGIHNKGVSLVEAVVAISVIATVLGLCVGIAALSVRLAAQAKINIQLTLLAEEALEGARAYYIANGALQDMGFTGEIGVNTCMVINEANGTIAFNFLSIGEVIAGGCANNMPAGFLRNVGMSYARTSGGALIDSPYPTGNYVFGTRRITAIVKGPNGKTKTLTTVIADID